MLPTARSLLGRRELGLSLVTPEPELPEGSLDQVLEWVHSSDLADPTPFLGRGHMLLTTGKQLEANETTLAAGYVSQLIDHGIAALGFGTEVVRAGVPAPLLDACLAQGLPLLEVPYRTPFIAVARAVADMASEERFARSTWVLGAQRAISLAALRPNGLGATLDELSKQLSNWVALFDARGELDRVFPGDALHDDRLATVQREVRRLLSPGRRASDRIDSDGERFTLQTLGRLGNLRGVLAVGGSAELDHAGHEVLTSAIALVGLALEQSHTLNSAHRALRKGLVHTLLGGEVELVRGIARETWGGMPSEPIRATVVHVPNSRLDAATEYLELRVSAAPNSLFFGHREGDGNLLICFGSTAGATPPDAVTKRSTDYPDVLGQLCSRFEAHAGVSDPASYGDLPRAVRQAEQAYSRARENEPGWVLFETISQQGVLAHLARTAANEVARAAIAPVVHYDAAHGSELLRTLRVWLEQNGQYDPTSRVIGVHRHTVRSRITQVERLLGQDLSTFHARAEVWVALLAAE